LRWCAAVDPLIALDIVARGFLLSTVDDELSVQRRSSLLTDYGFVVVFSLIALSVPVLGLAVAWLIRPKMPGEIKNAIYECGLETVGETWVQFKVQYYIYALIFVIFDIETVFLYPWAVAYNKLGLFALIEMFIFIAILLGGLLYAWRKGALEWV